MQPLSFDSMAGSFDQTRVFDRRCFDHALDLVEQRFPPEAYATVALV